MVRYHQFQLYQIILKKTQFEATGLFIVISIWVLSFWLNETHQFYFSWVKNRTFKSYFESASSITGNLLELVAITLFTFGIGFHCASFEDWNGVIYPQFNEDHFIEYCSFQFEGSLVWAQASFR